MTTTARRRRSALLAACAFLLVPLAGACSSDGSDASPTTTTEAPADDVTTTTTGDDPDPETTAVPEDTTTTTEAEDPGPDVEPVGDAQAYTDALIAAFVDEANTDLPLDQADAECVAPKWIDTMGGRLVDAGVAPEDLAADPEDADNFFDIMDDAGDADSAEALVGAFADCDIDLTQLVADFFAEEGIADAEQIACFVDAVPAGLVEDSLTKALDGDSSTESSGSDDEFGAAAEACLD